MTDNCTDCELEDCIECPFEDEPAVSGKEIASSEITKKYGAAVRELLDGLKANQGDAIIARVLDEMTKSLADMLSYKVREELAELIKKQCGKQIAELAKEYMVSTFLSTLGEKLVISGERSWDQKEMTIKDVIHCEMKKAAENLRSSSTRDTLIKEAINKFMSEEVVKEARAAIDEFKRDTLGELSKGMMKQIVSTVAKAIGNDKKMLAILQAD